MLLTLDSSVIVAALRRQEVHHRSCRELLERVRDGRHLTIQPLTVLVEVVAAVARRTGSPTLAERVQRDLTDLPAMQFVELDIDRAGQSATVARETGLRGMDAIVVQTAHEFGAVLVSLDAELIERVDRMVQTRPVADLI